MIRFVVFIWMIFNLQVQFQSNQQRQHCQRTRKFLTVKVRLIFSCVWWVIPSGLILLMLCYFPLEVGFYCVVLFYIAYK